MDKESSSRKNRDRDINMASNEEKDPRKGAMKKWLRLMELAWRYCLRSDILV